MATKSESTGGYNPLRWICRERGLCWNLEHRPSIEYFAHALPRNISMTDLDATVEVNGSFLFLEFKSPGVEVPTGQRIYFERLTALSPKILCVVVDGVCRTMEINRVLPIYKGKARKWEPCDLDGLFHKIEKWAAEVDVRILKEGEAA